QLASLQELVPELGLLARSPIGADPQLLLARAAEQAAAAKARQEAVQPLLVLVQAGGEQVRREEPLHEVVDPQVALPPDDSEDPCLRESLEDRAHLVRRAPVPVDGLPRPDLPREQRPALPNPGEQL